MILLPFRLLTSHGGSYRVIGLVAGLLGAWILNPLPVAAQQEYRALEPLERSLEIDLARAEEPLLSFQLSYLEGLKKAEEEAQSKGALEEVLAVQKERQTYSAPGRRNYADYPRLQRLREIYESKVGELKKDTHHRKAETYREILPKFEELVRSLTQAGNVEEALAVSRRKEEIAKAYAGVIEQVDQATTTEVGIEEVLWELDKTTSLDRVRDIEVTESLEGFRFEKTNHEVPWAEAKKTVSPPFRVRARAKTEKGNLRFYYRGKPLLIFNWEVKPSELRFHDPATGRKYPMAGKGTLTENVFHDLVIDVLKDRISVSLNGKPHAEIQGNYEKLNGRVGIGPAFGSVVTVKEMKIISLD